MRQRYVDLIVRPAARDIAYLRSTVVRSIRESLHDRGLRRGRDADPPAGPRRGERPPVPDPHQRLRPRPVAAHRDRAAPQAARSSAGMEQVFEVGRQFRNEGADSTHNPEFTSLEVYETYGDYDSMRLLTQELIQEAAVAVYGAPVARRPRRRRHASWSSTCPATGRSTTDLQRRLGRRSARRSRADTPSRSCSGTRAPDRARPRPRARLGRRCSRRSTASCARATTTTPVFYTDFPKETSPLDPAAPPRPAAGGEVGPGHLRRRSRARPTAS